MGAENQNLGFPWELTLGFGRMKAESKPTTEKAGGKGYHHIGRRPLELLVHGMFWGCEI
jgi:hypothetical protein